MSAGDHFDSHEFMNIFNHHAHPSWTKITETCRMGSYTPMANHNKTEAAKCPGSLRKFAQLRELHISPTLSTEVSERVCRWNGLRKPSGSFLALCQGIGFATCRSFFGRDYLGLNGLEKFMCSPHYLQSTYLYKPS